jgi:hypothetical protein
VEALEPDSQRDARPLTLNLLRWYGLAFLVLAGASAFAGFQTGKVKSAWAKLEKASPLPIAFISGETKPAANPIEPERVNVAGLTPQQQAEALLESAIRRRPESLELIRQSVDSWRGHLQSTDRLFDLVLTALKSEDLKVRGAALDIDLAANNLAKSRASILRLEREIRDDPFQRPFALWRLGALGNRGVQPKFILTRLVAYSHSRDEQTRFWAVEGLAMLGTDAAVDPLLDRFAHDPSARVRQRAACGLAQTGMLTREQRLAAVPDLLNLLDDDALGSDTRSWVYGALRMITGEVLGNDTHAWQEWWANHESPRKPQLPKNLILT